MRLPVLCLQRLLLPLVGLLGSLALAHEEHFDVTDLHIIEEKGERFLGMRVTHGEHDTPLSFSAALINADEAILEVRWRGVYKTPEHLAIAPGVHVFDTASALRVAAARRARAAARPPRAHSNTAVRTRLFYKPAAAN